MVQMDNGARIFVNRISLKKSKRADKPVQGESVMSIKALLIGISVFEIGMLYWLLCGTVLEKEYFRKKRLGNSICKYCRDRYKCGRKS